MSTVASAFSPLDVTHPRYQLSEVLGKGASGVVVLARDQQTGRPVAVKLLERGQQVSTFTEREAFTHRMLVHPHIVRMKEVFLTKRYLGIVLEYAALGDLFRYVTQRGRLTEDQARWFFQQLMVAVDYLHRKMDVAHRDIKLENILLSGTPQQPLIKMCDFGYAKSFSYHSAANTTVGTPTSYDVGVLRCADMAPEVLLQTSYNGKLADVWSCGVVLYVMLCGRYPYIRPGEQSLPNLDRQRLLLQRLLTSDVVLPAEVTLSDNCKDLLLRMLMRNPQQRITSWDVLQHPWFQINLPRGVLNMNDQVKLSDNQQAADEVRRIIDEAKRVPGDTGNAYNVYTTYAPRQLYTQGSSRSSDHGSYGGVANEHSTERSQLADNTVSEGSSRLRVHPDMHLQQQQYLMQQPGSTQAASFVPQGPALPHGGPWHNMAVPQAGRQASTDDVYQALRDLPPAASVEQAPYP